MLYRNDSEWMGITIIWIHSINIICGKEAKYNRIYKESITLKKKSIMLTS